MCVNPAGPSLRLKGHSGVEFFWKSFVTAAERQPWYTAHKGCHGNVAPSEHSAIQDPESHLENTGH